MSVVSQTLDGERVAERDIAIADDHRQIRKHCGINRKLWLEAAYLSLSDSGWNETMLASLQLNPQSAWYHLLKDSAIRPPDTDTPRKLALWANNEPHRWAKLAMRTLSSRSWTLDMLAILFSISFVTAYRWNRDFDHGIDWTMCDEITQWVPSLDGDHVYSGIQATATAAARLRTLADHIDA